MLSRGARAETKSISGAAFGPVLTRPALAVRSCDSSVCAHAAPESAQLASVARAAFADAWSLVVDTMRVPRPLSDGADGGDPRLDVYVLPASDPVTHGFVDGLGVGQGALERPSDRDAAPAFLAISEDVVRQGGCVLRATAARAIVRASASGLDLAEDPIVVDGFARRVGELAAPCDSLDRAPFAQLQKAPFGSLTATPFGNQLLARTLDLDRGLGFGAIVPGLLSMAIGHNGLVIPAPDDDLGPAHFRDDPSLFDVLAISLKDAGYSLDELFLDVGQRRALDPIAPSYEWQIPTSTLPRRLAIRRGIEPTGYTFVRVDLDRGPPGDAIEMDLAWEQGARFVWRVLELDAQGKLDTVVPVPRLETTRKITVELRHLTNVKTVILVGFNAGDPARPWRSTEPPAPPHGYEIGIYPGT